MSRGVDVMKTRPHRRGVRSRLALAGVLALLPALAEGDFGARATSVKIAEGRPDVTEAAIIVSGGRGLKAPEHFSLVRALAKAFREVDGK